MEHLLLHAAGWVLALGGSWLYLRSRTRRRIVGRVVRAVSRKWRNARRSVAAVGRIGHPYPHRHAGRRSS